MASGSILTDDCLRDQLVHKTAQKVFRRPLTSLTTSITIISRSDQTVQSFICATLRKSNLRVILRAFQIVEIERRQTIQEKTRI